MAEKDPTPDRESKPAARESQTGEKDKRRKTKDESPKPFSFSDWASI